MDPTFVLLGSIAAALLFMIIVSAAGRNSKLVEGILEQNWAGVFVALVSIASIVFGMFNSEYIAGIAAIAIGGVFFGLGAVIALPENATRWVVSPASIWRLSLLVGLGLLIYSGIRPIIPEWLVFWKEFLAITATQNALITQAWDTFVSKAPVDTASIFLGASLVLLGLGGLIFATLGKKSATPL